MMVEGGLYPREKLFHNVHYTACYQNPEAKRQTSPMQSLVCRLDGKTVYS